MEWPARSDYRVMALIERPDGTSVMLSKFGTRRHPDDHRLSDGGVVVRDDESGLDIDLAITPPGTKIAAMIYRPPRARRTFADAPPSATYEERTVTLEKTSADVYTWVPFLITLGSDGTAEVNEVDLTSAPRSERRPKFAKTGLVMDAGLLNCFH